ncbi:MAG TPA: NAD-dependent epimerase/dehydratase family protein [Pyrinomonadaceae bacterium]|nr:NAD-dependent epimerase/dehydratase family protein [Pyrinomonadaceae bacterium]
MKLLILGGTKFLGRHVVEGALARGHEVTLFNRGRLNPGLFPEVEKLRGDRDGGLDALRGRRWDAVVDPSGYSPRVVRDSARLLRDAVEHYTFVSSQSAYRDTSVPGVDESYPVGTIADERLREAEALKQSELTAAPFFWEVYGALKALCERAAEEEMPGRVLQVRAGLVVGPHDYSDRFTYWPRRVSEGGEVLAPGDPERQVQFVDARDLAAWILEMAEARRAGTFNATGPDYRLTMGRVLEVCRGTTGSDARFVWADERFLLDAGVGPWMEMPLWTPQAGEDNVNRHFMEVSVEKALAAGLRFRPLSETVRDTLEWDLSRPADTERRAGLAREKEREVLEAWRGRGGA